MQMVPRIMAGLAALSCFVIGLGLWFGMQRFLPDLGVAATDLGGGLVGRATVRADLAGLFIGVGLFAAIAVIRRSAHWANSALLLVLVAICGRIVGLALDGVAPVVIQPLVAETVIAGLLFWLRASLMPRA